jgi:tetratricopeptide (TPR) repeat protein
MSTRESAERAFTEPPSPGRNGTLDDLVQGLRLLKAWAGNPSYDVIKDRINAAWATAGRPGNESAKRATVADCFKPGRRRLNSDLVIAVVRALHPDAGYVAEWRQALRAVGGETVAAAQVRVQDTLPQDLPTFTGREHALDQIRQALSAGSRDHAAVVIITGMAGIGKTQLAVRAGHLLARERPFDRVLFVNLRGFHPDPAQPPADPGAVLDGFLRLLGVPSRQIPHGLPDRAAAYRDRLAGTRTLVVLDNAAAVEQVRPLLPATPGCPVLVTSRRSLTDLHPAARLTVDVFTPGEALTFLTQAAPEVPVGDDPDAAARIAHRCGYLPLALGLISGHACRAPGWTLTDHADRLDERHRERHLDTGVELALDLSYRHVPAAQRQLLRLVAIHPGQDLDAYAAAALADCDLVTARTHLDHLCRDHLLQQGAPSRYTLHDLVRAYAARRAGDEDSPSERRKALTRLFDHYLAATATAMDTLHPADAYRRPRIPPADTPAQALTDPDSARGWLDIERPTLVAVAAHTASHGWLTHAVRLSTTLYRYLEGGHHTDALAVHGDLLRAARHTGDQAAQAHAVYGIGTAHLQLGRHGLAAERLRQALRLFRRAGDPAGQANALNNLGVVETLLGRFRPASDHLRHALTLFRQTGDRIGSARALGNLGNIDGRLGRDRQAADRHRKALNLCREAGDCNGEADALQNLGNAEGRLGQYGPATYHLQQSLNLFRRAGHLTGEVWALDGLGILNTRLRRPVQAKAHHRQALVICRETKDRVGEVRALNGLGEAALVAGRPADALTHHATARSIAADIGAPDELARAHTGLGHTHHALGNPAHARRHYQQAVALYTDLGMPGADQIRTHVTAIDTDLAGAGRLPRNQCSHG